MCVGTPSASPPSPTRCASVSLTRLGLAARDDDLGAGRHEPLGDRAPDAPRPAGDDRDATGQVEQRRQLFLVQRQPFGE